MMMMMMMHGLANFKICIDISALSRFFRNVSKFLFSKQNKVNKERNKQVAGSITNIKQYGTYKFTILTL